MATPQSRVDVVRKRFLSQRLQALMSEKGLSVTDVAKRMEQELKGERFNPVNLSHYRAGRSLPRPRYLTALSRVFGVAPQDLLPAREAVEPLPDAPLPQSDQQPPSFRVEDLSDGLALLQINQRLPWPLVLRVLDALKNDRSAYPKMEDAGTPSS